MSGESSEIEVLATEAGAITITQKFEGETHCVLVPPRFLDQFIEMLHAAKKEIDEAEGQ